MKIERSTKVGRGYRQRQVDISSPSKGSVDRSTVDVAAERLMERWDLESLQSYKLMVQGYLQTALAGTYRLGHERDMSRGRARLFYFILKINHELESMVAALLRDQEGQLRLMASIELIAGLLMDVYI